VGIDLATFKCSNLGDLAVSRLLEMVIKK
jgi:hypothetical protein